MTLSLCTTLFILLVIGARPISTDIFVRNGTRVWLVGHQRGWFGDFLRTMSGIGSQDPMKGQFRSRRFVRRSHAIMWAATSQ